MLLYWMWYALLPQLSLRQKLALLEHFSDPEDIHTRDRYDDIEVVTPEIAAALGNKELSHARKVISQCAEKQISILTFQDASYPSRLRNIPDPPLVLYYKGVLPDLAGKPVIGVVGTRKATTYGVTTARGMSRQIAACGGLVVSGGARGVDTAALEGALDAGGQVAAVLGCGVDVVYPKANKELFDRIAKNGCLISEYLPDAEPMHWQFPARNRIISGLSNGVLVVEAPEKSGALITARRAFEQGRDVFVVPGNIGVETCAGSNALLQDCASAALSGWDVLKDYAPRYPGVVEKREPEPTELPPSLLMVAQPTDAPRDKKDIDNPERKAYSDHEIDLSAFDEQERLILSCLDGSPRATDDVIARVGLPSAAVLSILTKLALNGVVINHPGRKVSVRR